MKMTMLKPTYWGSTKYKIGDIANIPDAIAERWAKAGIAEKQGGKPVKNADKE